VHLPEPAIFEVAGMPILETETRIISQLNNTCMRQTSSPLSDSAVNVLDAVCQKDVAAAAVESPQPHGQEFSRKNLKVFLDTSSAFDGIEKKTSPLSMDVEMLHADADEASNEQAPAALPGVLRDLGQEVSLSEQLSLYLATPTVPASLLPFAFVLDALVVVGFYMLYRHVCSGEALGIDRSHDEEPSLLTMESAETTAQELSQLEIKIQVKRPVFERPFHDLCSATSAPLMGDCTSDHEMHRSPTLRAVEAVRETCSHPERENVKVSNGVQTGPSTAAPDISDAKMEAPSNDTKSIDTYHHKQPSTMPFSDEELKSRINAIVNSHTDRRKQPSVVPHNDEERKAQINAIVSSHTDHRKQPSVVPHSDEELKAQINAIVGSHADQRQSQSMMLCRSDDELKAQMNEIVAMHAGRRTWYEQSAAIQSGDVEADTGTNVDIRWNLGQTSPESVVPCSTSSDGGHNAQAQEYEHLGQPSKSISDDELKLKINALVHDRSEYRRQCEQHAFKVHADVALYAAQTRKQNMLSCTSNMTSDTASPSLGKSMSSSEIASHAKLALSAAKERGTARVSPAKSLSDMEFVVFWNYILTAARIRNTPTKAAAPSSPRKVYQDEGVAPCQLDFLDGDDITGTQDSDHKDRPALSEGTPVISTVPSDINVGESMSYKGKGHLDNMKTSHDFDVTRIPSPTRSRAKKLKFLAEFSEVSSSQSAGNSEGKREAIRRNGCNGTGSSRARHCQDGSCGGTG
jgi:hypothetical protein